MLNRAWFLMALSGLLAAQNTGLVLGSKPMAWDGEIRPPWRVAEGALTVPPAAQTPSSKDERLRVRLRPNGTITLLDSRGIHVLRVGLPGRPLHCWRDGGTPLDAYGEWSFPEQTPLAQGLGGMAWGVEDFRPSLRGLLWILDDAESHLVVVHPATFRVVYVPLPHGLREEADLNPQLVFFPDRVEIRGERPQEGESPLRPWRWELPWMALLPQFTRLGTPLSNKPKGGPVNPFAR